MTLTDAQAIDLVKKNPNKKMITFFQKKYEIMRAHVTGIGSEQLIQKMESFERQNIMEARKKMMLSNKDVLARILKPINKIYTAKGGIQSFNLSTEDQIKEYKEFISACDGQKKKQSLKDFIKKKLQIAYLIDPMGLKWICIDADNNPAPAYKCIMGIYDYEVVDSVPEYVIFKCSAKEIAQYISDGTIKGFDASQVQLQVFRCVCDGYDRLITWQSSNEPVIVATIDNPFGRVQGEVVSDIPCEDESGNVYYESCLYEISELLNQMVFGRSIYNVAYSQMAYPITWMQAQDCPTCGGKGKLGIPIGSERPNNENVDMACPECKGSGVYPHVQNSDTYIFEFRDADAKGVPTPPLGVIATAIDNLQFMKENGYSIEQLMSETLWGIAKVSPNAKVPDDKARPGNNTSETAFEADLNEQPKRDKQKEFSVWGGNSFKWYADIMGTYKYEQSYISSAILWGDRYANESPDEIFTRITKAKLANAPQSLMQSLYLEYLDSKYENNPLEWRKYWLFYLGEPYFFFAVEEVLTWALLPQIQLLEKQLWGEFMCTLTDNVIASIPDDKALLVLQKMIRDFVTKKYVEDKKVDSLLFANDGSMLTMGDNARVKVTAAKKPEDLSKTFKVTALTKGIATLQCGDELCQYESAELERIF